MKEGENGWSKNDHATFGKIISAVAGADDDVDVALQQAPACYDYAVVVVVVVVKLLIFLLCLSLVVVYYDDENQQHQHAKHNDYT